MWKMLTPLLAMDMHLCCYIRHMQCVCNQWVLYLVRCQNNDNKM